MNKAVKFLIGICFSIIGLVYAFRQFNWNEFLTQMRTVNYWYIFISILLQLLAVWLRAIRWKWLMTPLKLIPTKILFDATMIGYFGNNVLPLRMGELLRAYVVTFRTKIPTAKVLGTLIVERLLDLIALIILAFFFLFFSDVITINKWLVVISIILITLFYIILFGNKYLKRDAIKNNKLFQTKIGTKLYDIVNNIIVGLSVLKKTPYKSGVYGFIILIWLLYLVSFFLVVKATGLNLNILNIGVLFVFLMLSISLPAAPGYIGTYHATAVAVLMNIYHINLVDSQTFAVISHAVGFVPFVIIGAIIFLKNSFTFSQLKSVGMSKT